jgi:hypothetical protein
MLRLAADENFNSDIVRGLLRRIPDVDLERIASGPPMPGVFAARSSAPIGSTIEALVLLAECSVEGEWEGQIRFLPL